MKNLTTKMIGFGLMFCVAPWIFGDPLMSVDNNTSDTLVWIDHVIEPKQVRIFPPIVKWVESFPAREITPHLSYDNGGNVKFNTPIMMLSEIKDNYKNFTGCAYSNGEVHCKDRNNKDYLIKNFVVTVNKEGCRDDYGYSCWEQKIGGEKLKANCSYDPNIDNYKCIFFE